MLSKGHKLAQGKPYQPLEKDILASCKRLLRLYEGGGHLAFIRVTAGGVPRGDGSRFSKNVDMAGVSDLLIWLKAGPVLAVELKTADGVVRPDQREFGSRLSRVGHIYRVVRSVSQLEELLVEYGAPRLTLVS